MTPNVSVSFKGTTMITRIRKRIRRVDEEGHL
jgi:hypothetical protein